MHTYIKIIIILSVWLYTCLGLLQKQLNISLVVSCEEKKYDTRQIVVFQKEDTINWICPDKAKYIYAKQLFEVKYNEIKVYPNIALKIKNILGIKSITSILVDSTCNKHVAKVYCNFDIPTTDMLSDVECLIYTNNVTGVTDIYITINTIDTIHYEHIKSLQMCILQMEEYNSTIEVEKQISDGNVEKKNLYISKNGYYEDDFSFNLVNEMQKKNILKTINYTFFFKNNNDYNSLQQTISVNTNFFMIKPENSCVYNLIMLSRLKDEEMNHLLPIKICDLNNDVVENIEYLKKILSIGKKKNLNINLLKELKTNIVVLKMNEKNGVISDNLSKLIESACSIYNLYDISSWVFLTDDQKIYIEKILGNLKMFNDGLLDVDKCSQI
ncbi:hypothetical protein EON71_00520 [bacterium]|nr:MAG: hypothetical protein EON71_00520 [bacterium]